MTYSDKVKASEKIYNYIQGMGGIVNGTEVFDFTYQGKRYKFCNWNYKEGAENILSVELVTNHFADHKSMNVDKVTKTAIHLFTFDMFGQRSTYKLPIYEMEMA